MSNLSDFFGSSGVPKVWVSGTTYAVGVVVLSPADNYQPFVRVVAGAGTTDPASDSTNWKPSGGRTIKSIQRGVASWTTGTSTTVTVTSVSTSKSQLHLVGFNTNWSEPGGTLPRLQLTSATQITLTRNQSTPTMNVSWQLVEYY